MSFGDVAARMKKKQEDAAPAAPAVRDHDEIHALRARILGVLLRDARLSKGVSEAQLASALNLSEDDVQAWEFGQQAPTLPQIEIIAYHLGVPVSHFWNTKTISSEEAERVVPEQEYNELRNRLIGAKLTMARQEAKLSQEELASATGLSADQIAGYELGESLPFPELTTFSTALRKPLSFFMEGTDRVGSWLSMQEEYQRFSELPEEIRAFVMQPIHQPFLEIAMRLSRLPVKELRAVAEDILNITF
ncbi:MAG TPA: helix-turn-helix transcriptional regulator [Aggregatilineales bacterium]|nr:helix-turn-helix transcriptional regulator [Aggregatilineales bacterium]